jgi:lipopolysaccharide export system permease protein
MKILDWYIFKKFMVTFIYALIVLSIITIVVDLSEKTDDFVKSGLGTKDIIMQYYVGFLPHIVAMIFPLFVFISVIFFTSKMAGRSEIIAILASGTSFRRFLFPYWVAAGILAVILFFAFRYVLTPANRIFSTFQSKYIDGHSVASQSTAYFTTYFQEGPNRYVRVEYDTATKTGVNFFLQEIENNNLKNNLQANRLEWETAKQRWRLTGVIQRKLVGLQEKLVQSDSLFIPLSFKPQDIKKDEYTKDKLTTPELARFIALQQQRGSDSINDLLVEQYHRTATPVSVVLLSFIGVSVASRKVRGGMGFHLAMGIIAAVIFIFIDRFSTMFSTKGSLPPMLAAWLPNIIFLFVAIYIYRKAPK